MRHRQGEAPKHFVRTARLQESGGKWYYATREGTIEGPFGTRDLAVQSLSGYIQYTRSQLFDDASLGRINGLSLEPI